MQVKIFSFADDIARLEKAINIWLYDTKNYKEIISTVQNTVYDDFTKKVITTITIWFK